MKRKSSLLLFLSSVIASNHQSYNEDGWQSATIASFKISDTGSTVEKQSTDNQSSVHSDHRHEAADSNKVRSGILQAETEKNFEDDSQLHGRYAGSLEIVRELSLLPEAIKELINLDDHIFGLDLSNLEDAKYFVVDSLLNELSAQTCEHDQGQEEVASERMDLLKQCLLGARVDKKVDQVSLVAYIYEKVKESPEIGLELGEPGAMDLLISQWRKLDKGKEHQREEEEEFDSFGNSSGSGSSHTTSVNQVGPSVRHDNFIDQKIKDLGEVAELLRNLLTKEQLNEIIPIPSSKEIEDECNPKVPTGASIDDLVLPMPKYPPVEPPLSMGPRRRGGQVRLAEEAAEVSLEGSERRVELRPRSNSDYLIRCRNSMVVFILTIYSSILLAYLIFILSLI